MVNALLLLFLDVVAFSRKKKRMSYDDTFAN